MKTVYRKLMSGGELGEKKPDALDASDWSEVKEIEKQFLRLKGLDDLARKNDKAAAEITREKLAIQNLKEKRDRQLRTINEILENPASADRIEPDDDTFAPGNWENLRRLAASLRR